MLHQCLQRLQNRKLDDLHDQNERQRIGQDRADVEFLKRDASR
jgi:hypothetical protein